MRERVPQRLVDLVTNRLWSSPGRDLGEVVRRQKESLVQARTLVRAFYAFSFLFMVDSMNSWERLVRAEEVKPLWTAWWLQHVDHQTGMGVILSAYVAAALLALVAPRMRLTRLFYFVAYMSYIGVLNGFGKIQGHTVVWAYAAGLLVLLPSDGWRGEGTVTSRHRFLTGVWNVQVGILVMYTLSGLWKVGYAIHDLVRGPRISTFQPDGFSVILAKQLLEVRDDALLGDELFAHPNVGWLMYLGAMYMEVCALLIAFRPRLARLWGVGLILFHVGTQLTMDILFPTNIALLALFLVNSPWAPERFDVRAAAGDLPGVYFVRRNLTRLRRHGKDVRWQPP